MRHKGQADAYPCDEPYWQMDVELLGAGDDQDFLSIGLIPLAALLRKHALAGTCILRNPGHAGLQAISLSP
ncbi:MAG: hypothetical protein ACREIH_08490 [Nitrospiraceae bacterium]